MHFPSNFGNLSKTEEIYSANVDTSDIIVKAMINSVKKFKLNTLTSFCVNSILMEYNIVITTIFTKLRIMQNKNVLLIGCGIYIINIFLQTNHEFLPIKMEADYRNIQLTYEISKELTCIKKEGRIFIS